MSQSDRFIARVLKNVTFKPDHTEIRAELLAHIDDRMEYYLSVGYDEQQAVQMAVEAMGDPDEIGRELNRVHHVFIGWLYYISRFAAIALALVLLWTMLSGRIKNQLLTEYTISNLDPRSITAEVEFDKSVKLDDVTLTFTKGVVFDQNIFIGFKLRSDDPLRNRRYYSVIGEITDIDGNELNCSSSIQDTFFGADGMIRISPEFPDAVVIDYSNYGRSYRVTLELSELKEALE